MLQRRNVCCEAIWHVRRNTQRSTTVLHRRIATRRPDWQKDFLIRHLSKCKLRHPPGDEIYRNGDIAMFEVRAYVRR